MGEDQRKLVSAVLLCFVTVVFSATDPNDLKILNEFRKGLENPELLEWPANDDPCGTNWRYVFCSGNRVTQLQSKNLGLKGPLPQNFNQLTELSNLGLQRNELNGKLPTFKGLSQLQYAYLGNNKFDTIPYDFVDGLSNLEVLSLDNNPLNATTGWSIPSELQNSLQLTNLSLMSCNLNGPIPDFLGTMSSLANLKLSYNRLSGGIPASFKQSPLQTLWLNNQGGVGLTGPIDVIGSMTSLTVLWLHGNQFTGTIPADIGQLTSLKELNLNQNQLSGPIPDSLAGLDLQKLDLSNNLLMGPIPKFKTSNVTYTSNPLCQSVPGVPCAPEVTALIDFLGGLNYPVKLASSWKGNDPCQNSWLGLTCNSNQKVSVLNLPKFHLNGTLSPSIGKLDSLTEIELGGNNITGRIPANLTSLKSLRFLDLSGNNIEPPIPEFSSGVKIVTDGNPLLNGNQSAKAPSSDRNPSGSPSTPIDAGSSGGSSSEGHSGPKSSKGSKLVVIVAPIVSFAALVLLAIPLSMYYCKKRKGTFQAPSSYVVHPRDPSDPENMVKIVVSNSSNGSLSTLPGSSYQSINSTATNESHVIESGNLVISVQVLRNVTKNFAPENELGKGGFGRVYKGELDDGTKIAVKRMESSIINNKALNEFQSEIAVLSKVRHRHLVSLLGYSIEGNERLLVYEYMPQGALSKHLFQWDSLKLEPLSWKRRLNIALDVARGMEYLHNLARESFIHRDLKSSNILLGDDFRAKVSDFGLVKLAPDGAKSVVTQLAGTFGYLAPEYAVTGKITTKADVFSFGVVLMELVTGLIALDESRPEETRYLAAWFWHIKSSKERLRAAVDRALEVNEETFESICIIAELAGHCTAREPHQRPDMGHAVNVLSPLVEKWKPVADETEEYSGIDYNLPLTQMVKGWQEAEDKDCSYSGVNDSKGSIPSMPTGFASSFNSADGR
ncbi:Protein kinase domain [Macleaya cordata]|uniref:non-specific serine/threonine protein kinase n=1 Tax=Macleaya cordata TaxID=56857 RepID=A0A200Q9L5_MACCD|nr:Protein kinase domain [Macleaya cordata]